MEPAHRSREKPPNRILVNLNHSEKNVRMIFLEVY
jgi:hypothetical protein